MSINVGFEGAYPASMDTENVLDTIALNWQVEKP